MNTKKTEAFWYDGYDYTVDPDALERHNFQCVINDTQRGLLLLQLERKKDGSLDGVKETRITSYPNGCLRVYHVYP